jgi:hypothetical protein
MKDETDAKLNAIKRRFFHNAAVFSLETLTAFAKAMEGAYELGFADAEQQRETTKDAGERYPYAEAYDAGVSAFKAGKSDRDNPYHPGERNHVYWVDGFLNAGGTPSWQRAYVDAGRP